LGTDALSSVSYRLTVWCFSHLIPKRFRYASARFFARVVFLIHRPLRRILQDNLTPLIGADQAERIAPRVLMNFAETAVDFFSGSAEVRDRLEIENGGRLAEVYRSGTPVMAVTAHWGHWEMGPTCLTDRGYPVSSLYSPFADPHIDRWMKAYRDPRMDWVPVGAGAPYRCFKALEQRRIVGMVADIPFGEEGQRVSIKGQNVRLPLGPWIRRARAKATVFPCFIMRKKTGTYQTLIHDPIRPGAGPPKLEIQRMLADYVRHLEYYLTHYPEQWGVLAPFWERSDADQ
jgi:KDO2-lipid IV(A) lauroyltransferase